MVRQEGLEKSWERHRHIAERLVEGLRAMGLQMLVEESGARLGQLNVVKVPDGVD